MPDRPPDHPPAPRMSHLGRALLMTASVTLIGLLASLATGSSPDATEDPGSSRALLTRGLLTLVPVTALLWAACRFLDRRPMRALVLTTASPVWAGPLTAVLAVTLGSFLALGAAVTLGGADVDKDVLAQAMATAAVMVPLLLVAHVLPEELVFRGYVLHLLGRRLSRGTLVLAQAALFAVSAALVGGTPGDMAGLFLLGVLAGVLRTTTGEVWTAVAARTALIAVGLLSEGVDLGPTGAPGPWEALLSFAPVPAVLWAVHLLGSRLPGTGSDLSAHPAPGPRRELVQKGILYDVGSTYAPGQHTRERWRTEVVDEEMRVIGEDLHCTAVTVFGEDPTRLEEAARLALERGLFVWLQPRLVDAAPAELVSLLDRTAQAAERLHRKHPARVGLNVGCELSLFVSGILPGRDFSRRTRALGLLFPLLPLFNARLNRLLRELTGTARARFHGPLTYGSGTWENVDWEPFDVVGVDYYLDASTRGRYRRGLRALRAHGRPIVVTEFGCCSYQGAREKGGAGADVLDWSDLDDRRVRGGYVRDERVQADYIDELLDVFETEDVHGAFVCMFIEGDCRYSPDPTRDCDMASFGIVRPPSLESGLSPDDGHWEPKAAFHTLAERYARTVPTGPVRKDRPV